MCHVISVSGRIQNICLKWHLIWISESWKHQNCLEIRRMQTSTWLKHGDRSPAWVVKKGCDSTSSVHCRRGHFVLSYGMHRLTTYHRSKLSTWRNQLSTSASSFLSRRDAIHFHYTADAAWTGLFVIFLSKSSTLTSCVFFYKWLFYNTKRGSFLWTIFSLNSQCSGRNYRE